MVSRYLYLATSPSLPSKPSRILLLWEPFLDNQNSLPPLYPVYFFASSVALITPHCYVIAYVYPAQNYKREGALIYLYLQYL